MINSKDTKYIKEQIISALLEANGGDFEKYIKMKSTIEKAFDIVIKEMEQGGI